MAKKKISLDEKFPSLSNKFNLSFNNNLNKQSEVKASFEKLFAKLKTTTPAKNNASSISFKSCQPDMDKAAPPADFLLPSPFDPSGNSSLNSENVIED